MSQEKKAEVLPSTPIEPLRLKIIFGIFAVGFVYILVGLVLRQLVEANKFQDQYETQSRRLVILPPARGRIYDRHGYVLVDNRVRWSVRANLADLEPEFRAEYRKLLAAEKARDTTFIDHDHLRETAKVAILQTWLNKVWYVIDENNKQTTGGKALVKAAPLTALQDRIIHVEDLRKHLQDRRALPFTLISDLAFPGSGHAQTSEQGIRSVARFIEQFPVDGPVTLESDIVRTYPYGSLAAHVLGYVKDTDDLPEVNDFADLQIDSLSKLKYTGKKGAAGIEQSFDEILQGRSGWELWTKSSAGYNKSLLTKSDPVQGQHIFLSLDIEVQKAAEKALAQIKDSQGNVLPAAAIMLDVNTGEILAMASQPTFDPNRLADRVTANYYNEIEEAGGWLNRAIQGLYPPGSTFKVITAIAGMRHKVVDWDTILECGPSYRVGGRDFPEHDPAGYGEVDLNKMLAVSCNVWNYQVGVALGIDKLADEARRFGVDAPLLRQITSPDVTSEFQLPYPATRLVVPDAAYKQRIGAGAWTAGDTANVSIGQGFLLTSPLHMACVAASLARGETRTTPYIIHDKGRDGVHLGATPIGISETQLNALRGGMQRCVEEGTARSVRIQGLPYSAKTGTSEYFKKGEKAHLAWIMGYAPADNPAVAFCVLVEGQLDTSTWGGKTAGPVARDMILAWAKKTADAPETEPGR